MIDTSAASPQPNNSTEIKPPTPWQEFKYETRFDLKSADDIWFRADYSYYHNLSDLQKDFEMIFNDILAHRCLNLLAKVYLTNVYTKTMNLIKSKKDEFKEKWRAQYDIKFA